MQLADPTSTVSAPLHPLASRVLGGRYELCGFAGSGGAASVFRAHDRVLGRTVAVKVLDPHRAGDHVVVSRFQHEAEFAANLSGHPNVVSVYDVGADGGLHYIVMEAVEGQSLRSVIEREAPLPVGRALTIAQQIASALAFAHAHGLVHRDIKPENILLLAGDHVKVTDFGIARNLAQTPITDGGAIMGTSHYLSPEQVLGKPADARSDIYALGVVLYEMLTGRVPFNGGDQFSVGMRHVSEAPQSPDRLQPAVPASVAAVVLRALRKDPAERYADAEAFAVALQRAARQEDERAAAGDSQRQMAWRSDATQLAATRRLPVEKPSPARPVGQALSRLIPAVSLLFLLAVSALAVSSWLTGRHPIAASTKQKPAVAAKPPARPHRVGANAHAPVPCSNRGTAGLTLVDARFTPVQVAPGGTATLNYQIYNSGPCRKLYLGATVQSQTIRGFPSFSDPGDARVVTVPAGLGTFSRPFVLPRNTAGQTFALTVTLSISGGPRVSTSGPYYSAVAVSP